MKKTFCDNCGEQCVNTTINVGAHTVHHTNDGKTVGEVYYTGMEICKNCGDKLAEFMPKLFVMRPDDMETPIEARYIEAAEVRPVSG